MKKVRSLLVIVMFFAVQMVCGQMVPPPMAGPPPPPGLPVDGGLVFLMILGAAYGAKKLIK